MGMRSEPLTPNNTIGLLNDTEWTNSFVNQLFIISAVTIC